MSISDDIRALAKTGIGAAEIARKLGIRYQHAYNVLKSGRKTEGPSGAQAPESVRLGVGKPPLSIETLVAGGFLLSSRWLLSEEGELILERPLPKTVGVYAFAMNGLAVYVGVATMGLSRRLHFYGKPGATQRTSQRLNAIIRNELRANHSIDIYTAAPPSLQWNGLPIHGSAGLELGLIKAFSLPWNMRSAR